MAHLATNNGTFSPTSGMIQRALAGGHIHPELSPRRGLCDSRNCWLGEHELVDQRPQDGLAKILTIELRRRLWLRSQASG